MKKWILVLAAMVAMTGTAQAMTGFLSVQKLIMDSKAGKQATRQLQSEREAKGKDLLAKKQELDTLREAIAKAGAEKKDISALVREYGEREKDLKRQAEDADQDLKIRDRELTENIFKMAEPIVAKVAKAKKMDMVVTNPAVLGYVSPEADITNEVVKELDQVK